MAANPEDFELEPQTAEWESTDILHVVGAAIIRIAAETGNTTGSDLYLPGTVATEALGLTISADQAINTAHDGNYTGCAIAGGTFILMGLLTVTTLTWVAKRRG